LIGGCLVLLALIGFLLRFVTEGIKELGCAPDLVSDSEWVGIESCFITPLNKTSHDGQ